MNRTLSVARIQTFTPWSMLVWPWGILASALTVNIALFASIGDTIPGGPKTGGLASIYVTATWVAAVTSLQHLPFALGFGVTRRTFHRATGLLAGAWALSSGIALYLLALVERATDGWGVRMAFFDLPFLARGNPLLQIVEYAVPLLMMTSLGLAIGLVQLRWGVNGVMVALVATIVLIGASAVVVSWARGWATVAAWLAAQSTVSLTVGWPALVTALAATFSYLVLRRATV
jgi:hypothetical protein